MTCNQSWLQDAPARGYLARSNQGRQRGGRHCVQDSKPPGSTNRAGWQPSSTACSAPISPTRRGYRYDLRHFLGWQTTTLGVAGASLDRLSEPDLITYR